MGDQYPLKTFYVRENRSRIVQSKQTLLQWLSDCIPFDAPVATLDPVGILERYSRRLDEMNQRTKGTRVRAIVYRWSTGWSMDSTYQVIIEFALCTFFNQTGTEAYTKKGLRATALARFARAPQRLVLPLPAGTQVYSPDVRQAILLHLDPDQ